MDKELIENIANALAVSEICPFAHEDCIDNCHKHFSNWLDNHDKQIRAEVIAEISREMRMLYGNEYEKKIRADAINEFANKIKEYSGEHYLDCDGYGCQTELVFRTEEFLDDIAEQLKEQK